MALRLAEKGNDVIITYQSQKDSADAVVQEIKSAGKNAAALQLDVSVFKSLDEFVQQFASELQKWNNSTFDFFINNAGIGATIPFGQVTEDDFDRFMNIHFKSVYFLTQNLLPMMNDEGRIINISTGTTRFLRSRLFSLCFHERRN
jgi:NAD(P)-dependent dehydrogenase (short-subunit alcohol dehydrogenase family)